MRVCERWHPLEVIGPRVDVTVGTPQLPVKVGVPGGGTPVMLQPRSLPAGQLVMTNGLGGAATVKLAMQVTGICGEQLFPVRVNVATLVPPQAGGAPASTVITPPLQPAATCTVATQVS